MLKVNCHQIVCMYQCLQFESINHAACSNGKENIQFKEMLLPKLVRWAELTLMFNNFTFSHIQHRRLNVEQIASL